MRRAGPVALAAGLALAVTILPAPAHAGCLIFCPKNDEVPAARAAPTLSSVLGQPLPDGVAVLGMIDGGFQDRFIQVKLTANASGLTQLLSLLKVDDNAFGPLGDRQTTINAATWWDIDAHTDVTAADATLPGFAYAFVARAHDLPDSQAGDRTWTLYILAVQT